MLNPHPVEPSAAHRLRLVVVGNGMAGIRAVEELLKIAPDLYDISVFGAEPHPNYNRILLSPVLAGEQTIEQIILKMVNRRLPPGVNIKGVTTKAGKGFAVVSPLFDLVLSSENYAFSGEPLVATWESISGAQEAEEAIAVAKALLGAGFTSTVLKTADATEREERYVKSVVAEPNLVDKTTTDAKGRPTGAIGDMLTMEDIRLAAHWWMEHSQLDTFTHLQHGGVPLTKGDVGLLENYLTDGPVKIGSRNVPAGSWVQAYRIYNDVLWADIKEGRINGWSIGAFHKVAMMDVPASEIKRV